jgi:hypothetical protein
MLVLLISEIVQLETKEGKKKKTNKNLKEGNKSVNVGKERE